MSLKSALGFGSDRKIRYGFVGLGDIAQEAMLPGVDHTGNSQVTALVTGDPRKADAIGERYGVADSYGYDQFGAMLSSDKIDAIYLATPNWRHAEFVIPALKAGIHVLVEKPLEVSAEKAEAILEAARAATAKLMVAYRLHFEPATLDSIRRIRAGEIGVPRTFTSSFSQMVDPENHRAKNGALAGPLFDMGPYPLNAARYLFGEEPVEVVSAIATRHPDSGFADTDDTVAVTLRFPDHKTAQFTVSYFADTVSSFIVAGTKGVIQMNPAYGFGDPLEQLVSRGGARSHKSWSPTDQFGGELRYFSDCILHGRDPEPDAEEGLADVRVLEAIQRAIETGERQPLPPFQRGRRIDPEKQVQELRAVKPPKPVDASSPTREDA
jgi:predicted dehydrogenase